MKRRTLIVAPVVVALALAAVGGIAAYGGSASNPEAFLPPQVETPITKKAYEDAYATFENCMRDGGAPLVSKETVGSVHQFSYATSATDVYDKCYEPFAAIDFRWQIAHEYESPTQVAFRECLTEIGVEPAKTAGAVWGQMKKHKIDPVECTLGPEVAYAG